MARHVRDIVDFAAGPLDEVFEAEQANARLIAAERAKADAWLAAARADIDRDAAADRAAVDDAAARDRAAAQAAADAAGIEIVRRAERLAARLGALDDERLRAIIRRHLGALTPRPGT